MSYFKSGTILPYPDLDGYGENDDEEFKDERDRTYSFDGSQFLRVSSIDYDFYKKSNEEEKKEKPDQPAGQTPGGPDEA